MYRDILLPTDGSPLSRKAIRAGIRLAKAAGARVTGFYAAPPATPLEYRGALPVRYTEPAERAKVIERTAARNLDEIARAAKPARVRYRLRHETSDFPAEAIITAAKRNRCDLIFLSSHGRHGFRPSMLGSQTQKVLAKSPVPVLVHR